MRHSFDIVLDTNVVVAALRSKRGASNKLLTLIGHNSYKTHLSVALVLEYEDVLKKFSKEIKLTLKEIEEFLDSIVAVSEKHQLFYLWRPCLNNPNDEMILELAVKANAEYIVTHNLRHFNQVKGLRVRAITPKDFLKIIGE